MSSKKSIEDVVYEIQPYIKDKYIFVNYINSKNIILKNKFGEIKVSLSDIKKGYKFGINSAVDSKNYAINSINDLNLGVVIVFIPNKVKGNDKIIIRNKYGELEYSYNDLVVNKNTNLSVKSAIDKTEYFINQAKEVHGDKYDYSLVQYKTAREKVKIICPIHGVFEQIPTNHIRATSGCFRCRNDKVSQLMQIEPKGWSKTNWINSNKTYKKYKLYLIKCWNETEEFYKIGRTYNDLNKRFGKTTPNKIIPYKFQKIFIIEHVNGEIIYDLENNFKKLYKNYKYLPKIKFKGMYECFKIPETEKALFEFDGHTTQDCINRLINL